MRKSDPTLSSVSNFQPSPPAAGASLGRAKSSSVPLLLAGLVLLSLVLPLSLATVGPFSSGFPARSGRGLGAAELLGRRRPVGVSTARRRPVLGWSGEGREQRHDEADEHEDDTEHRHAR